MVPVGPYKLALDHGSGSVVIGHSGVAKFRDELDEVDAKFENDVLTGATNDDSVKSPAPGFRSTCPRRTSPPLPTPGLSGSGPPALNVSTNRGAPSS
jgi:hypothetical protein